MVYDKTVKEVFLFDLQFVHPNAAKLSGTFFPKFADTKLVLTSYSRYNI